MSAHDDAMRDALALMEAVQFSDLEGGGVILENANLRLTAAALARIAANVLEDWTDDPAEAFALLREHRGRVTAGQRSAPPGVEKS